MVTRYVIRLYLFGLILAAGFAMLLWRLWVVQIEDHKKYLAQLPQSALVFHRTAGIRGEIRDTKGRALATNKISYEIKLDLREINHLYRSRHKDVPKNHYSFKDPFGTPRLREEADIFAMYEAEVAPQLKRLHLFVEIDPEEMRLHYRTNRGIIPFTYRKGVGFDEIALVAEQSQFLAGVTISKRTLRHYPYGAMLGHVLGYVEQIGELDIPEDDAGKFDFYEGDDEGIAGIEKQMNAELRARAGQRVFPKDEHGKIVHSELMDRRIEPIKGDDVYLTIDVEVQSIAEMALREAKVGRGAAVVMNPANGDVLALVSVPSYDPNKFIPEIEYNDWMSYKDDKSHPLMNRALSAYAPGSVYKVPIALAGCARGQSKRIFSCGGGMRFGGHFAKCTGNHGSLGLSDALMRSCNGFFYRYGMDTGIKAIDRMGEWFSLGRRTGIELPREAGGILPGPDPLGGGETWTEAQTAFTSIGQGQVLATPLQMCAVAATVANGGLSYRPKLIAKIYDHAEKVGTEVETEMKVDLLASKATTRADLELVRKGMWKVVNGEGGTARGIRSKEYEIAGKTGTAQAWLDGKSHKDEKNKDYKTWFIAFAPYENPKYAVCVFVENGTSGGGTSAPIAARILKQAMARDGGTYTPPLQPLAEAKGHFDRLERTVYADDPVDAAILAAAAANGGDPVLEEDPPSHRRPAAARRSKPSTADQPKIKNRPSGGERSARSSRPAAPAPAQRNLMDKFLKRDQAR